MARVGIAVAAPDGPQVASDLLRTVADGGLVLDNATLSDAAGRIFLLATARCEGPRDADSVERSLDAAVVVGTSSLVVDLASPPRPVSTQPAKGLVCLLASAPDRAGLLHEFTAAIATVPAGADAPPRRDIRYLASSIGPAEGLPATCFTDAVFYSPDLANVPRREMGESLDALARAIAAASRAWPTSASRPWAGPRRTRSGARSRPSSRSPA